MPKGCRRFDMRAISGAYRKRWEGYRNGRGFACIYCGEPPDGYDHVFPVWAAAGLDLYRPNVRKQLLPHGLLVVPTCRECNQIAGGHTFTSILKKRCYIQARLRQKYHRLLDAPDWSEEELLWLSGRLRRFVDGLNAKARVVFWRANWPRSRRWLLEEARENNVPVHMEAP